MIPHESIMKLNELVERYNAGERCVFNKSLGNEAQSVAMLRRCGVHLLKKKRGPASMSPEHREKFAAARKEYHRQFKEWRQQQTAQVAAAE